MYGYVTDDECVDKKAKGTKKCVIKRENKISKLKKSSES